MKTLMTTLAVLSVAVTVIPLDTINRRLGNLRARDGEPVRAVRRWLGQQVQQAGRWIQGESGGQTGAEDRSLPQIGRVEPSGLDPQATTIRFVVPQRAPAVVFRPSRPVRLHIDPVDHRHAVIAGSMADVCAMLDRLAAADEPVRGVPAH